MRVGEVADESSALGVLVMAASARAVKESETIVDLSARVGVYRGAGGAAVAMANTMAKDATASSCRCIRVSLKIIRTYV